MLFQDITQTFHRWNTLKIFLHFKEKKNLVYFRERQIWWTSIGQNIGVESQGKNAQFERPVLVFKKFNADGFLGVPLSTKPRSGIYYLEIDAHARKSYANLSQIRMISSKRLIRKISEIDVETFLRIQQRIRDVVVG